MIQSLSSRWLLRPKSERSSRTERDGWPQKGGRQTGRNTNHIGWIPPAIPESLSWLSCCRFSQACTWAKETHLDGERSNGDGGTQHKYASRRGGAEERRRGGAGRHRTASIVPPVQSASSYNAFLVHIIKISSLGCGLRSGAPSWTCRRPPSEKC